MLKICSFKIECDIIKETSMNEMIILEGTCRIDVGIQLYGLTIVDIR